MAQKSFKDKIIQSGEKKTAETFWREIASHWKILYMMIQKGSVNALQFIDMQLPDDCANLHISLVCNSINGQDLDQANGLVVMHISANNSMDNIPMMNYLYNKRIKLPNLLVAKYASFNIHQPISAVLHDEPAPAKTPDEQEKSDKPDKPDKPDIKLSIEYDKIKVHCQHGFNENKQPTMNLIITCPKEYLEQKKIVFKAPNEHGKKSERLIWMLRNNSFILDRYLLETLGECNMLHFISYIEIIPEEESSVEVEYLPLESLRSNLELVVKLREPKITSCSYCDISELQMNLTKCSCKKFQYCGEICITSHKHACE